MAKESGTISYWLRTEKKTKDNKAPIFIIFSVRGVRSTYNTGLKIYPFNWCEKDKKVKFIDKKGAKNFDYYTNNTILLSAFDVNNINAELNEMSKKIFDEEKRYKLDKVPYSSKMVIDNFKNNLDPTTIKETKKTNVADWILWYSKELNIRQNIGTIKCYTGLANHLKAFEQKNRCKVTFLNIDLLLLEAFGNFLNITQKQNNTTAAKQISTLKTLLKRAEIKYNVEVNNSYKNYTSLKRDDTYYEVIVFDSNEIEKIKNIDLSNNLRLDKQRDVLVFSMATGFRHSDLEDLKWVHIKSDGFIRKEIIKTKRSIAIPLIEDSNRILEKYKNELKPLPTISETKTTAYIKEIAELCGIDEKIEKKRWYGVSSKLTVTPKYKLVGIHTGRKSFITSCLNKGMSIPEVMKLSGHTSYKSFQRYVHVSEQQLQKAMIKAHDNKII
jgi:site-specific recombinase XerD